MIEPLIGFFTKSASMLFMPAWKFFVVKFLRPKIRLPKAPQNILDHLRPCSSRERVTELLGPPHQTVGNFWSYSFSDSIIQIEFWPESGAKYIALGLTGSRRRYRFSVPGCKKPLGLLSIADVLEESSTLHHRLVKNQGELLVTMTFGASGAYNYWTFGALFNAYSKALIESYFQFDIEAEKLKTPPSEILINWVAVSNSPDEVHFDCLMG